MAPRVKAGGVKPKAKKTPKPRGARAARRGDNLPTAEEATAEFDELFALHKKLGEVSGRIRKEIADAYATTAKRLDVPKKIIKHQFALEKHRRETIAKEREFDGRDRDALMKLSQMFGESSPFGEFALRAAGNAKKDEFGGSEEGDGAGEGGGPDDGEGGDAED